MGGLGAAGRRRDRVRRRRHAVAARRGGWSAARARARELLVCATALRSPSRRTRTRCRPRRWTLLRRRRRHSHQCRSAVVRRPRACACSAGGTMRGRRGRRCALVRDAGVELSVDLICGVPGQTMASWAESLEQVRRRGRAARVGLPAVGRGRHAAGRRRSTRGSCPTPDPDLGRRDDARWPRRRLGYAGLARYEVANYAERRARVAPQHGVLDRAAATSASGPGRTACSTPRRRANGRVCSSAGPTPATWRACATRNAATSTSGSSATRRRVEMLTRRGGRARRRHARHAAGARGGRRAAWTRRVSATCCESLASDGLVELVATLGRAAGGPPQRGWLLGNEVFGRIWAGE